MPIQILMPALSPTMTEGNVARWLKKEGDTIKAGQVIAEIETDKATMEVEAVDEGKLLKILFPAGTQGIKVNTPIALLSEEGEENSTASDTSKPPPKTNSPTPAETKAPQPTKIEAQTSPQIPSSTSAKPLPGDGGRGAQRVVASPLAKRLAGQSGIELSGLQGSGPGGRVIKADVDAAIASGSSRGGQRASPSTPSFPQGIDARDYAEKLGMAFHTVPNSTVRKVIAKRLQESKQLMPHFYLTIDCEIDALLALRKSVNESAPVKVSVNDCIIRAVALAMKKVPAANVSWTEEAILQYEDIDISVAVATPNGLVTPIIKKADTKTLIQLSTEMKDLGMRAREGKLRPVEFQGGGFTISNLGMFGIREFAAIINPPQACILAVGAGEERAVVKKGLIAIATVMSCTLSVDHRAVDGAVGAEFLAAFKPLIENPYSLVV